MTVDTTYTPATYTGDGSTTEFSLNHLVFQSSHVTVTVDAVETSAWSATGYGDPSGITVTFDTAPTSGAAIVIQRIVPYTQDTDLENFDGNPADVTEKQFDLLAMADQQIAEASDRSVLVPIGTTLSSNEISGTIDSTSRALTITSTGIAATDLSTFGDLDVSVSGVQAGDLLVYGGSTWTNLKNNLSASTAPTASDDSSAGYAKGSRWIDTTSSPNEVYECSDASVGAAVWLNTSLEIGDLGNAVTYDVASQVEAEAGTATDKLMTPERTKQAIDALSTGLFSEEFTSSAQTITASGGLTLAHGLSSEPKIFSAYIQCTSAENNYSVGDKIPVAIGVSSTSSTTRGVYITDFDSTNIYLRYGQESATFAGVNKTAGTFVTFTNSNWRLYVQAYA